MEARSNAGYTVKDAVHCSFFKIYFPNLLSRERKICDYDQQFRERIAAVTPPKINLTDLPRLFLFDSRKKYVGSDCH